MTVALHHVDEGPRDAPVIVLCGSLGSTVEMWSPQVEPLTERFRVIRVDHRGHGGSPVPPGPYTIADMAGDVLALLDSLGLDRVAYCGLSMGGCVGMHLASEAPERISALTLCCTSSYWPDPSVWVDRIAAVESGGTAPIAATIVSRWFTPSFADARPEVVAGAVGQVAMTPDDGYASCCAALRDFDHRPRLGAITAPTLVIAGSADPSTPVEPHARTIVEGIPGARLEVLDAAHLATIEQSEQAAELIAGNSTA
ncbi:3-oxoadipate enol-lactonase [Pseudonocardia abyssalis]|uniref:3-oxoadipate enol-lactonase n=1 Tax=Pseudonocardia abyssalis TaxID=2792008 RepID=A0ABS6UZC8_9PSEU|nr:3-oxoadipate enol-lactonase [Pseudonocardia abyssalis]MBW0117180.1 3-oxoadipate enol-lactonase [Pseudonocardia abyssalis]MBW0137595.1 3-oxoadipate enol-lactonase [Pseudonocardia abyssalis]